MVSENTELFESMPIGKAVRKLMIPTIMGALVMVIYSLADTYFVGKLNDPVQNAAVTLAAPMLLAFNAINNLFGIGASSMMSRALGAKDPDTVKKSASFGFYGALGSALLLSVVCTLFFGPLLRLLGADAVTLETTAAYMRWTVLCGAVPSVLNVVLGYMIRSVGYALQGSIGVMSGCLLNILLDPIFILPWGLGLGAAGAGLATFLSNSAACLYFLILLLVVKRGRTPISLHPKYLRPEKRIVRGVFGVGIPAAVQNLLNVTGLTLLNNFIASYGAAAVAGVGIAYKIYMVPVQVALGGTQGAIPLVSYNFSAGNPKRMEDAIREVLKMILPAIILISLGLWIFAGAMIGLFIADAQIIDYGRQFLRGYAVSLPFLLIDFTVVGVLQGIGRGKTTLLFALLRKIVFEIPAIICLNALLHTAGITYAPFVSELVLATAGIAMLFHIRRELWQNHPTRN